MGLILDFPKRREAKGRLHKLYQWCLQYAVCKKISSKESIKFLKENVPEQLWYQVQLEGKKRYNV